MNMQAKIESNPENLISVNGRSGSRLGSMNDPSKQHCEQCALNKLCIAKLADQLGLDALNQITSHPKPHHKGEYFYRQDDAFDSVYIVRSGAVKTYYLNEKGEEHITGFYLPGELFGIDGLNADSHRYSAQALDTTAVCSVPYEALERLYSTHPEIQRRVTDILCEEIFQRQQSLLSLRQSPAEQRLASFLVDISRRLQLRGLCATDLDLPMSRRDIAKYLGLAEETMSRLFTRLQEKKLLSVHGRNIGKLDIEKLRDMAVVLH